MALTEEESDYLQQLLDTIGASRARLSQSERGFFDDQVRRFDEYGANMRLTPKQWKWLEDIKDKL